MQSLDAYARDKLEGLARRDLRRELVETVREPAGRVLRDGRSLVSFSCNDYFGLARHPDVVAAAAAALQTYGAGAGASRLVTGEHPPLRSLEAALAAHKGLPAALVFGSGFLANVGVPGALVGREDMILIDELSHASMFAGARLSGASVVAVPHNDMQAYAERLARKPEGTRCLVMTESVFSMDGDRAPVSALGALAEAHDAWLLVDDAHGLDGPERAPATIEVGTLSKGLGSYGGYVAASGPVVALLRHRARSLVYATGLPPASAAAAEAALRILVDDPARRARPLELARRFTAALGLPPATSAIVPWIVGEARAAVDLSRALENDGFLVVAIRPPTVPEGTARLRIAFSAAHDEADVDGLVAALRRRTGRS